MYIPPMPSGLPLLERLPALAALPRASLGRFPSPVEPVALGGARGRLWLKRDDLDAPSVGGNKVRALEFLLGGVGAGDTVLTLGGEGSTHVLATAHHAARLGARTVAIRWPHEMHEAAHQVAAIARAGSHAVHEARTIVDAFVRAWWLRQRHPDWHWVPFGGSTPRGALGHVNAALELAAQVRAGALPAPRRIVVALGSGGTTAGLLVGLALAGLEAELVAVRVGPRIGTNRTTVLRLARRTRRLLERLTSAPLPPLPAARLRVLHEHYGGAYGRPLAAGTVAARFFADVGLRLEATYTAKAAAAALAIAREAEGDTVFWLTFDGRVLEDRPGAGGAT
jgi:D-cysteine desulfhydrase